MKITRKDEPTYILEVTERELKVIMLILGRSSVDAKWANCVEGMYTVIRNFITVNYDGTKYWKGDISIDPVEDKLFGGK